MASTRYPEQKYVAIPSYEPLWYILFLNLFYILARISYVSFHQLFTRTCIFYRSMLILSFSGFFSSKTKVPLWTVIDAKHLFQVIPRLLRVYRVNHTSALHKRLKSFTGSGYIYPNIPKCTSIITSSYLYWLQGFIVLFGQIRINSVVTITIKCVGRLVIGSF